jgi:formylglycine-generating enzyme required for sulfatase activity
VSKLNNRKQYNNRVGIKDLVITGGGYEIGSPETEANRSLNERLHRITLSPFEIMVASVTQEQYAQKMGENPSYFQQEKYGPESFKVIEVNGKKSLF